MNIKVFKFYSEENIYCYSGKTEEEAKQCLFEQVGEMTIDKVEEISESDWDDKNIDVWEDNDFESEPYQISIREQITGDEPQLIFTNDLSMF